MDKIIAHHTAWGAVADELAAEQFKLQSYDRTLIALSGSVDGKRVLDYGCGPGVLARTLLRGGAEVGVFDVAEEMLRRAAEGLDPENVYASLDQIERGVWDMVVCNLVVCINEADEVKNIAHNIRTLLAPGAIAYIGFCNPHLYDVRESQLDLRPQTDRDYHEAHHYRKTKIEGPYEVDEFHRDLGWYDGLFRQQGLTPAGIHFTPSYQMNGRNIRDFVIFELELMRGDVGPVTAPTL